MPSSIRLSEFILVHTETILVQWEKFARTVKPQTAKMDSKALRDHAEQMLRTIALDLTTTQTKKEQADKSKDLSPNNSKITAAEEHAQERLPAGFSIEQLFSEYRALRASVLQLWEKHSEKSYQLT